MWQVLRFLYFHQSVYIYISLFPPPLVFHSRTSYFCAHVLRRDAFFQIVSSIASTIAHGSRRARSVNFNSRDNIVSQCWHDRLSIEIPLAIFGHIYYRYLWCSFVSIVSSFSSILVAFIWGRGRGEEGHFGSFGRYVVNVKIHVKMIRFDSTFPRLNERSSNSFLLSRSSSIRIFLSS